MNVPLIEMTKEQAQEKLRAYRDQLNKRRDDEYEMAVQGYQILAEGKPLLLLTDAIAAGGLDERGRPRLAIARADRQEVRLSVERMLFEFNTAKRWREPVGSLRIHVPHDNRALWDKRNYGESGWALVPMVPAEVRPAGALSDFFILWEVERWADRSMTKPDRDPYLLRHITGDLYAVIAEWDLTDLERAVMTGRRST